MKWVNSNLMIDFIIRLLLDYNSINPFSLSLQSKQKEKFSRVHSKVVPIIDSSFQVNQLYELILVNIDKKKGVSFVCFSCHFGSFVLRILLKLLSMPLSSNQFDFTVGLNYFKKGIENKVSSFILKSIKRTVDKKKKRRENPIVVSPDELGLKLFLITLCH